jgi:hypothetical protein
MTGPSFAYGSTLLRNDPRLPGDAVGENGMNPCGYDRDASEVVLEVPEW